MALPTDSSDTFIREVEENYRRDQLRDFAKTYGKWVIAAIILFLGAIGGWLYWQEQQRRAVAEDSEELAGVYNDIGAEQLRTVPQRLDALAGERNDIVRASAKFTRAALAIDQNDTKAAISIYRDLAQDEGLPEPYRNTALVRATALEFDSLRPEEVISRLEPLAKAGEPWFGSAAELTALAYLKQGKTTEAGRLFAAIAADRQVPDSIRSRSVQIAGTLGVDATASLPGAAQ